MASVASIFVNKAQQRQCLFLFIIYSGTDKASITNPLKSLSSESELNNCAVSASSMLGFVSALSESEMETGRVASRVEILRPAGQAG